MKFFFCINFFGKDQNFVGFSQILQPNQSKMIEQYKQPIEFYIKITNSNSNMKENNQNALRRRLYLNYSSKHHTHQQPKKSLKKNTLSGTLLIPKIYAETHKKMQGCDRTTMNFRDGKIVIDNSFERFRRSAERFKETKELRENRQMRQPMQPIEPSHLTSEARSIIQASKGLEVRKIRKGDERNLTPQNIFSFFQTFPEMQLDFFYLNKHTHPYDYRIVPFGQRNPQQYMTISCKGVTQFLHGQAHFMTRQQWLIQQSMYRQLQQIDFFFKYKVNKNFRIWKNMMKRHYMRQMSNMLNQRLFAAGNSQNALMNIRQMCLGLEEECKMLNYDSHQPYTLEEFKADVHKYQNEEFVNAVSRFEQKITAELAKSIEQSLETYREENNLGEHKKDGKPDEKMDYSKEALLRTHYGKVSRLIKLVDSLLLESKATMVQNNLQQLLDTLRAINQELKSDELLLCKVEWNGHILQLSPDRNKVKDMFLSIVHDALKVLHNQNFNLEQQPEFKKYRPDEQSGRNDNKKEQKLTLKAICSLNEDYQQKLIEIAEEIDVAFDRVEVEQMKVLQFANIYEKHQRNRDMEIDDLGAAELRRVIAEYREQDLRMQCMQEKAELGLVLLDFTELRQRMRSAPAVSRARLLQMLPGVITSKSNNLCQKVKQFSCALSNPPLSIKAFVTYTKDVNRVSNCLQHLSCSSGQLIQLVSMMQELRLSNIQKYKLKVREATSGVVDLRLKVDEANANYDQNLSKFRRELEYNVKKIQVGLVEIMGRYGEMPLNRSQSGVEAMIEFMEAAKGQVRALEEQAQETNNLEAELSLNKSSFDNLDAFCREFYLVEKLWVGRREWKNTVTWVGGCHFLEVKHDDFKNQYEKAMLLASMLLKEIQSNQVTKVFLDEVKVFKMVIDTLAALQDKNLKDISKWSQIPRFLYRCKFPTVNLAEIDETSLPLYDRYNKIYTVNWLIREEISFYKDQLCDFGVKAAKEKELNETFTGIVSYLEVAELSLVQCSEGKEGIVLGNNQKLFQTVDDQLMVLNSIMASRYVENFRPEVEQLARQMRYLRDLFDEMQTHQANWTYLEPLLASSSYSSKHLPKQSKEFATCDGLWRRLAKSIRQSSNLKRLAADMNSHSFMRILTKNNASFEMIKKSLEEYIERKRISYPRFYFLSNQELLEILSKARTPKTLEPYLHKLFEHVQGFAMDKDQPNGVTNFLGENLLFKQFSLRPQAQIQQILKAIEQHIKRALSSALKGTLPKYEQQSINRATLIQCYPFQISSITDWILWTKICEDCLEADSPTDQLYQWSEIQGQQIVELTQMIKKETREKLIKIYSAVLLQSIYLKERTEVLYKKQIVTPNDYDWMMTVKFYLGLSGPELYMRQFGSRIPYGFEFQGPLEPMVITPQTEKAWLKLRVLTQHRLFGCLEGNSSSGKSETLRQLSGLMAQNYVVYQCNSQSGLKVMERILVGLCLTGSWATFENYDRVKMETLSSMAGHLQNIRRTLIEGKDNLFLVKGTINFNSNMTITLTKLSEIKTQPYQLPESLKGMVRSISLVQPNLSTLYPTLFRTQGFLNYQSLAVSLSRLLQYCSEVFVYQPSLDFGVRTARLIIKTMRNKSLQSSHQPKQQDLLWSASKQVIGVNLDTQDHQTLLSILSLLSPTTTPTTTNHSTVRQHQTIDPTKLRAAKIQQLSELLKVKKGVIVVGGGLMGKTSLIKMAAKTFDTKNQVKVQFINHQSLTLNELYGDIYSGVLGLIPAITKQAATVKEQICPTAESTEFQQVEAGKVRSTPEVSHEWIVLDGKLAPYLINFSHIVDQSQQLALPNGQKLHLPNLRILFQTDSLQNSVPSLFCRVGTLSTQSLNTIQSLIQQSLQPTITQFFTSEHKRFLSNALSSSIKKVLAGKKNYSNVVLLSQLAVAEACCNLVKILMRGFQMNLKEKEGKEVKRLVDRIAIWAVVWGFGGNVEMEALGKFQKIVGEIFKLESLPTGSVFSFCLSSSLEWVSWESTMPIEVINPYEQFSEVMIWTADTHCCGYFIRSFLQFGLPFALIGQPGSGKSTITRKTTNTIIKVQNSLTTLPLLLSPLTTPTTTQSLLQQRLQWQRRNGHTVLMPPPGKKLLIQIQDMNLSNTNSSVLELLRQVISHKGLFDRRNYSWKNVEDVVVNVVGRVPTTEVVGCRRFLNRFALFSIRERQEMMGVVFGGLVKGWLKNAGLSQDITKIFASGGIIESTLKLYHFCKSESKFATAKIHPYLVQYTSKDVFNVFHSISRISSEVYCKTDQIVRLWANEIMRTFSDRLALQSDKEVIYDLLKKQIFLTFKFDLSEGFFKQPLLYAPSTDKQQYSLFNYETMCLTLGQKMLQLSPKFSLILYKELVEHIIHLVRVLTVKFGHFLLIGPRACGKKSITKLACFVAQVQSEFDPKTKLVNTLMKAAQATPSCLYVTQQNLLTPEQLSRVLTLLTRSIFPLQLPRDLSDRLHSLFGEISHSRGQPTTSIFFQVLHKYLHIVIASSPGPHLRNLILEHPQLATSCTVDFMTGWPEEALYDVAAINMTEEEFTEKERVARVARMFHKEVEGVVEGNGVGVSPRKYLELISLFTYKYHVCREESMYTLSIIPKCLEKYSLVKEVLQFEQDTLNTLDKIFKIFDIQPEDTVSLRQALADSNQEDDEEVKKNLLEIVSSKAKLRAALKTASQKLNAINRNEMMQLHKTMPNPQISTILSVVSHFLDKTTDMSKFTNDAGILWKLKTLQFRSLTKQMIHSVRSELQKLTQTSFTGPLQTIRSWASEICEISQNFMKQLQQQIIILSSAKFNSKCVLAHKIGNIEAEYVYSKQIRETLEQEIRIVKDRVRGTREVYEALEGCEVEWASRLEKETNRQKNLTYNLFLACAAFGYLGPFNQCHREKLLQKWIKILQAQGVSFSRKLEFGDTLFDPFEVESLRSYTEENLLSCLLMIKSPSVPYFIDPNGVSTQYLLSIHPDLKRFRINQQGFPKSLQGCIKGGQVVLLDYPTPTVQPSIRPIVTKNYVMSGNRKILRLNQTPIQCPQSFKLFLTNSDPTIIPDSEIFDNCCVVKFDLTDKNIAQQITNDLFTNLMGSVKHQIEEFGGRVSEHTIELKTEEERILKITDGINLEGVEVTGELERLREKKEGLQYELIKDQAKLEELNGERTKLKDLIDFASGLAIFVFKDVKNLAGDAFGDYCMVQFRESLQAVLLKFMERLEPEAADRDQFIKVHLVKQIYSSLITRIPQKLKKIFNVIFFAKAHSLHSNSSYTKVLDTLTSQCQLSQTLFMDYAEKLKEIPEMKNLVAIFEKEPLEFEAWAATADFSDPTLTYKQYEMTPYQRLIVGKYAKSQEYLSLLDKFLSDYFGEEPRPSTSPPPLTHHQLHDLVLCQPQSECPTCQQLLTQFLPQPQPHQPQPQPPQSYPISYKLSDLQSQTDSFFFSIKSLCTQPPITPLTPLTLRQTQQMLQQVPVILNVTDRQSSDPIVNCLYRQCEKYNLLVGVMRNDLECVRRYHRETNPVADNPEKIVGLVRELESGRVPEGWGEKYVGREHGEGLKKWFEEFRRNHDIIRRWWLKQERPKYININCLFYPQYLLTTILLKFAKKFKLKPEKVCFGYKLLTPSQAQTGVTPDLAVNISDISLKNCRFDLAKGYLEQCEKSTITKCPVVQLYPMQIQKSASVFVKIPVYRNLTSEQLVCHIELPTKKRPEQWDALKIKAFCQL